MVNTIEAIEITREFASDMQEVDPRDSHFDFVLETVARNISLQTEHLENKSHALVTEAERLQIDVENAIKK